jgi:hypothetical protein
MKYLYFLKELLRNIHLKRCVSFFAVQGMFVNVRFQVLTMGSMKITVFWDVVLCSVVEICQCQVLIMEALLCTSCTCCENRWQHLLTLSYRTCFGLCMGASLTCQIYLWLSTRHDSSYRTVRLAGHVCRFIKDSSRSVRSAKDLRNRK